MLIFFSIIESHSVAPQSPASSFSILSPCNSMIHPSDHLPSNLSSHLLGDPCVRICNYVFIINKKYSCHLKTISQDNLGSDSDSVAQFSAMFQGIYGIPRLSIATSKMYSYWNDINIIKIRKGCTVLHVLHKPISMNVLYTFCSRSQTFSFVLMALLRCLMQLHPHQLSFGKKCWTNQDVPIPT
jgi:predicted acylesterase/phospholipase RssA